MHKYAIMGKRILFKKKNAYGTLIDTNVHSCDEWGIMPTKFPYVLGGEIKEPSKNEWANYNGDDEYIPDTPKYKAVTQDFEFVYKGNNPSVQISNFLQYLTHGGVFDIYDENSQLGYAEVRYVKYNPNADFHQEGDKSVVTFSVNLKINDITKRCTLAKS